MDNQDHDYYPRPREGGVLPSARSTSASLPTELRPAPVDTADRELLACLGLCAPSGMSDDQRLEWVKLAQSTVSHIPADLLSIGCAEARRLADHPAKIVPIIIRTAEPMLDRRKRIHDAPIPEARRIGKHALTAAEAAKLAVNADAPDWFKAAFAGATITLRTEGE